jgi:hypothetical protein
MRRASQSVSVETIPIQEHTDRLVVGTAGYKNYGMYFRGFLIGTVLAGVIDLIITVTLVFL